MALHYRDKVDKVGSIPTVRTGWYRSGNHNVHTLGSRMDARFADVVQQAGDDPFKTDTVLVQLQSSVQNVTVAQRQEAHV